MCHTPLGLDVLKDSIRDSVPTPCNQGTVTDLVIVAVINNYKSRAHKVRD